jgi:hypothetical protein
MFGRKRRARLAHENAALREALGWYATSSNWRKKGTNAKGDPRKWIKSPAAFDRGARAKFVLSQLDALDVSVHTPPAFPARINTTDTE